MSRYLTELGDPAPDIPLLKTLEMDFVHKPGQPYGGLRTEMFPLDAFPWLWRGRMDASAVADASLGRSVFDLQGEFNGTRRVRVDPSETYTQLVINRESQYYVRRHEQAVGSNGLPELVYLDTDNSLTFRSTRTPAAFEDKALGNMDSYEIVSFNSSTREIRFKGLVYDRKEPSDDGKYATGKYRGAGKFLRDMLDDDTEQLDLSWKLKSYPYGHAKLSASNRRVTYDRLIDDLATDPPGTSTADTYHTMRLRDTLSSVDYPPVGSRVYLYRRLPFISGSLTTAHTWSQKYWMLEIDVELAHSFWQFFAVFGWNMYQETTDGLSWNGSEFLKSLKDGEIDFFENPCGDPRWRFHNAHAPHGGQYNMAALQGRTPLMPECGPEWDRETMQQHQLASGVGLPYTQRVKMRQYWYPPGNAAGKPSNSLEWYLQDTITGTFLRIGGCLAPSFWANGQLDDKQVFFNAGVGGDFTRGLNYSYGGGVSSAPKVENFFTKIYAFTGYQFPGHMAGGAGAPAPDGSWPEGKQPTPGDLSGNSGSGIVGDDGGTGGGGGGPIAEPGDGDPVNEFETTVDVILLVGRIVVPKVGKKYPIAARLIRNTQGYGHTFVYQSKTVSGYSVSITPLTADGSQAEMTFLTVGTSPGGIGLILTNLVQVRAVQTTGAGTARKIKGEKAGTPSGGSVPTDPGDAGGGSAEDEDPTITVTLRGPAVEGTTIGIPVGASLSVQVTSNQFFYATVDEQGAFVFQNFGTQFHNAALTVAYSGGKTARSATFYYDNPAQASGVTVLRYEVQSVGPESVTLYLGLSEDAPARIKFGTVASNLDQERIVSSTSTLGDDADAPHIYKVAGLTNAQLYFFQMDDQVSGSYTTSVIQGTPSGEVVVVDPNAPVFTVAPYHDELGQDKVTIRFTADKVVKAVTEVRTGGGAWVEKANEPSLTWASHIQRITGLAPDTVYEYQVTITDANDISTTSPIGTFTTTAASAVDGSLKMQGIFEGARHHAWRLNHNYLHRSDYVAIQFISEETGDLKRVSKHNRQGSGYHLGNGGNYHIKIHPSLNGLPNENVTLGQSNPADNYILTDGPSTGSNRIWVDIDFPAAPIEAGTEYWMVWDSRPNSGNGRSVFNAGQCGPYYQSVAGITDRGPYPGGNDMKLWDKANVGDSWSSVRSDHIPWVCWEMSSGNIRGNTMYAGYFGQNLDGSETKAASRTIEGSKVARQRFTASRNVTLDGMWLWWGHTYKYTVDGSPLTVTFKNSGGSTLATGSIAAIPALNTINKQGEANDDLEERTTKTWGYTDFSSDVVLVSGQVYDIELSTGSQGGFALTTCFPWPRTNHTGDKYLDGIWEFTQLWANSRAEIISEGQWTPGADYYDDARELPMKLTVKGQPKRTY